MTRQRITVLDERGWTTLIADLLTAVDAKLQASPGSRYVLGIAGVGGSGKSTLAGDLLRRVEAQRPGAVKQVAMDGFHFTNAELIRRGLRDRKGAPETFDAAGLADLLAAVRQRDEAASDIRVPTYDRKLHEPVFRDEPHHRIDAHTRLVIVEGNYLLLDQDGWPRVRAALDACWYLDTPADLARQWIISRHVRGGRCPADAAMWYEQVDGPNAKVIAATRQRADRVLRWP